MEEYEFTFGDKIRLLVFRANMKALRSKIEAYKARNTPPEPPIVQVKTFEAQMSGRGYDEEENPDDPEYQDSLGRYNALVFRDVIERHLHQTALRLETQRDMVHYTRLLVNPQARQELVRFIYSVSEVTAEAVAAAEAKFWSHLEGTATRRNSNPQRLCSHASARKLLPGAGRYVGFKPGTSRSATHTGAGRNAGSVQYLAKNKLSEPERRGRKSP